MLRIADRRVLLAAVLVVLIAIAALPALVAYRYSAPEQRGDFLRHPWRGWAFAYAAVAVPADSELKTSGMALRKAEWVYKGSAIDPLEVQLLFTTQNAAYTFDHVIGTRHVTSTVTPSYRFMWQVRGSLATIPDSSRTVVAILDYKTGRVLYDVRDDLLPSDVIVPIDAAPTTGS
ncbi:MAG: hypothetical protein R2826_04535 [Thermoleophilia bacterium]